MKTIVNVYSLYSEKEWNEKDLNSKVLFTGMVYKDGDNFFVEVKGKRFTVPSKNGMVKKRSGYSILLNGGEVKKLNKLLEAGLKLFENGY